MVVLCAFMCLTGMLLTKWIRGSRLRRHKCVFEIQKEVQYLCPTAKICQKLFRAEMMRGFKHTTEEETFGTSFYLCGIITASFFLAVLPANSSKNCLWTTFDVYAFFLLHNFSFGSFFSITDMFWTPIVTGTLKEFLFYSYNLKVLKHENFGSKSADYSG